MRRFLALFLMLPALASADSIRCRGYLLNTGDSQSRALQLCGTPQSARQDGFIEQIVYRNDGAAGVIESLPLDPYGRSPSYQTEYRRLIPVYRWEYNFGHGTFLRILTFHGDTLVNITDGPRQ